MARTTLARTKPRVNRGTVGQVVHGAKTTLGAAMRRILGPRFLSDMVVDIVDLDTLQEPGAPRTRSAAAPRRQTPERLAAMADYQRARRGFSSDGDLAEALGVQRRRLAAWKRGSVAPNAENARALSHLAVVVGELGEFLDPDVISDWLLTEQYTLSGRTPVEAIRDGRLADVLYAANATEHGAYV